MVAAALISNNLKTGMGRTTVLVPCVVVYRNGGDAVESDCTRINVMLKSVGITSPPAFHTAWT